ncbi:acyltransferase [Flavobacteriaceae bacterium F08102]|nr:acyltransferase [Flavobacteriaceae bacterium F08102]
MKGVFLKHIHFFRGFAILNVAFVHLLGSPIASGSDGLGVFSKFNEILFHGSTIYFLYISGFLFYYLSSNFNRAKFYRSKLKNVILPYVLMTTVFLLFKYFNLVRHGENNVEFLKIWIENIVFGKAQYHFWYIPFIAVVYFVSPLLLKVPQKIWHYVMPIFFILPVFGTRTGVDLTVYQFIYFVPIYIIGMYSAMNYKAIVAFKNKYLYFFIAGAILSTVFLYLFYFNPWKSTFGVINLLEGLYYIQKISITGVVLVLFKSIQEKEIPLLNSLATFSFGIYFTHLFFDGFFRNVKNSILDFAGIQSNGMLVFVILLYAVLLILINLYVLKFIKNILGKNSKSFIGV